MARPVKKYPKRNVVSFRLTDPEIAALRFLAEQVKKEGETFNDTVGRFIKNAIKKAAEQQYAEWKMFYYDATVNVSVSQETPDDRRRRYREAIDELRAKTAAVFQEAAAIAPERSDVGEA